MLGGGLCWLDYDGDGWLDLFAVNSYAEREVSRWEGNGGLPRTALFHNVEGKFVDVSAEAGADLAVRGTGASPPTSTSTDTPISTSRPPERAPLEQR